MSYQQSGSKLARKSVAVFAVAVLTMLAGPPSAPVQLGVPAAAAEEGSSPCIIAPHLNAGRIDCGVAQDRENSPFYPSRLMTEMNGKLLSIDQFDPPELCKACHAEIYGQWKGSMHSNAWNDPIYLAVMRRASTATNGFTDKLCLGCHTPIGVSTGEATPAGDKLGPLARNGVQCDFCHNVSGSIGIGNASFILSPRKYGHPLKFGPFRDARSPYHDTTYSDLHTKAELCGTCHNVTHPLNRLPIERTYDEWKDSPYPAAGLGCQECHMTPGPGYTKNPGRAATGGEEREHVFTHYFVGGNTSVPAMLGSELHAGLAREMLQGAATMELKSVTNMQPGAMASVVIRVHNSGAGHKLPTGFPEGREMWVDFRAVDGQGHEVFRLGRLNGRGEPEEGSHVFKVVLGDDEGKVIDLEVWKATRVLYDNRILPKGFVDVRFEFPVPKGLPGALLLKADLCYHSFSQGFVDFLLGSDAPKVPTVIMTSLSESVKPGAGGTPEAGEKKGANTKALSAEDMASQLLE